MAIAIQTFPMYVIFFWRRCFAAAWQETLQLSTHSRSHIFVGAVLPSIGLGFHWHFFGQSAVYSDGAKIASYAFAWVSAAWGIMFTLNLVRSTAHQYQALERRANLDRRLRFDDLMRHLQYLVSARELWWVEDHKRSLHQNLEQVIRSLRTFFPPEITDDPRTHHLSLMYEAASLYGFFAGCEQAENDFCRKLKSEFQKGAQQTIHRFERQGFERLR